MRFQIDEHREELNKKISEIALEMIDETKEIRSSIFPQSTRENTVSFHHLTRENIYINNLQNKLYDIEDSFRYF